MHLGYLSILHIGIFCLIAGCNSFKPINENETIFIEAGNLMSEGNDTNTIPIGSLEVMKYEVTNTLFKEFTDATGYITAAEKNGGSMVFVFESNHENGKWEYRQGASWKDPLGNNQGIKKRMYHPVVQVNYEDACAFCEWMHMRLPTAAEWQYIFQKTMTDTVRHFNYWQGIFPFNNSADDGFLYTSPVGYFQKNNSAPADLKGNVWEWTQDYFHSNRTEILNEMNRIERRQGPPKSFDPADPYIEKRVICGGSFLCAENYCRGYTSHVLQSADQATGSVHIGFRCVRSPIYP